MGICLWVKEKVAKLRRKNEDDDKQLQTLDGGVSHATPGCSALFARALRHRSDTAARKKTRSRSHADRMPVEEDEGGQWKPCVVCVKQFQSSTSKYLDYCSIECKTQAFVEKGKGNPAEMTMRASEWI